jgi:hypothetical protein
LAFHSGREADHSPPSSAEVKKWVELYLHFPNTPSWCGAQGEHRDREEINYVFCSIKVFSVMLHECFLNSTIISHAYIIIIIFFTSLFLGLSI